MKSKIFINAVLGISVEVFYAFVIILAAFVVCLLFNLR